MGRQTPPSKGKATVELYLNDPLKPIKTMDFLTGTVEPSRMAIGTERNAINHQGHESFDGEIARFLIYKGAMNPKERKQSYDYIKQHYLSK